PATMAAFNPKSNCSSDLFDLAILQIHRRRTAEDRDRDLDSRAPLIDVLYNPVEGSKGSVSDTHRFANLERNRRLWPFDPFRDLSLDPVGLEIRNRHRFVVGTQEPGNLGGIFDEIVDVVAEVTFHQHIAGKKLPFGVDFAAAANFH